MIFHFKSLGIEMEEVEMYDEKCLWEVKKNADFADL